MDREQILIESYRLLGKAVSGKGKFRINERIKGKCRYLRETYGLHHEDLVHALFEKFIDTGMYLKFNPVKTELSTFIAHYANYTLLDLIRKYDTGLHGYLEVNFEREKNRWVEREDRDIERYRANRKRPEPISAVNHITPEDYYFAKHLAGLISDFFDEGEILVLLGCRSRKDEAERLSVSYEAYCKRLARKTDSFKLILKEAGYC